MNDLADFIKERQRRLMTPAQLQKDLDREADEIFVYKDITGLHTIAKPWRMSMWFWKLVCRPLLSIVYDQELFK